LLRSRLSETNIVLAELGEQAALVGAAGLFKQSNLQEANPPDL